MMMAPPNAIPFDGSKTEKSREELAQEMAELAGEEGTQKLREIMIDIVKFIAKIN